MVYRIEVLDIFSAVNAARRIVNTLNTRKFYVVTYHSRYPGGTSIIEDATLKEMGFVGNNDCYTILLKPRRRLSFCLNEKPTIVFERNKRIDIIRNMPDGDIITKVILIPDQ